MKVRRRERKEFLVVEEEGLEEVGRWEEEVVVVVVEGEEGEGESPLVEVNLLVRKEREKKEGQISKRRVQRKKETENARATHSPPLPNTLLEAS